MSVLCPPAAFCGLLHCAERSLGMHSEECVKGLLSNIQATHYTSEIQNTGHKQCSKGVSPAYTGLYLICADAALQSLTQNELRERVILRADGGMRSGKDVMLAAALGADEYGFGTVAMIATGCIMARVCHTNNCPVGVASQREELRARFPGAPADLVR